MKELNENLPPEIGYEPEIIYKKKGGIFGKIISLILGILLGFVACFGTVAILVYTFYTKSKIDDSITKLEGIFGSEIDYTYYINESYGQETLQTLVGDVSEAASQISAGNGSLNTLANIVPLVRTLIVGNGTVERQGIITTFTDMGIQIDPEQLMNRLIVKGADTTESNPDVYLTDYLSDCLLNTPVGDLLSSFDFELNEIILTLCYGVSGVDYIRDVETGEITMLSGATKLTLGEFLGEEFNNRLNNIPIDALVSVNDGDDLMHTIAYGPSHRYGRDSENNIVMNQLFYKMDFANPGILYDDEDNNVTANILSQEPNLLVYKHTYTKADGTTAEETQYLKPMLSENRFYAFKDEACTSPIKFRKTTVGDLREGSSALIDNLYLKDILNITATSDTALIALAYGGQDVDWEFDANGNIQMIGDAKARTIRDIRARGNDLINDIYLSDMMNEHRDNPLVMYLLYGKEGLHYDINPDTDKVRMLPMQVAVTDGSTTVHNEYGDIELAFDYDATARTFTMDGKTYTLGTASGKTLASGAPLYFVLDENGNQVRFQRHTLGDIKGSSNLIHHMTGRLTLADVLGEDTQSNSILQKLSQTPIDDMPSAINNLTLADVFENEIYEFEVETDEHGNVLYQTDEDGNPVYDASGEPLPVYKLDADGNKIHVYETDGTTPKIKALWKYLLNDKNGEHTPDEYFLLGDGSQKLGLSNMITNMKTNVQKATLSQLVSDDLVMFDDNAATPDVDESQTKKADFLDESTWVREIPVDGELKAVQELTIIQIINYVLSLH